MGVKGHGNNLDSAQNCNHAMCAALKVVFAELKPSIHLATPGTDAAGSLEQAETSVLMLGELTLFPFFVHRPQTSRWPIFGRSVQ